MNSTSRVHASISGHQISSLFKSLAGKIPPAFWGLRECLPEDITDKICRWYADGPNSSDKFELTDKSLQEMRRREFNFSHLA